MTEFPPDTVLGESVRNNAQQFLRKGNSESWTLAHENGMRQVFAL